MQPTMQSVDTSSTPAARMLVLAFAGCVGCSECPTFEEIEISDEVGGADEAALTAIQGTIDEFAAWTGAPGVCVGKVKLVPEDSLFDGDATGQYRTRTILLDSGTLDSPEVLRHELCHAVDFTKGNLSLEVSGLFDPDTLGPSPLYDDFTDRQRTREVFAKACESGPLASGLARGLQAVCGTDFGADQRAFVNAEVYAAWQDTPPPLGALEVTLSRRAVTGDAAGKDWDSVVASGPNVYALDHQSGQSVVYRIDPTTAASTGTVFTRMGELVLVGSDGDPLLLTLSSAEEISWWISGEPPAVVRGATLPGFDEVVAAAIVGADLWAFGRFVGEEREVFVRLDLGTGAREDIELPAEVSSWKSLHATETGLFGVAYGADSRTVAVELDVGSREWTVLPLPLGSFSDAVALADGSIVVSWSDSSVPDGKPLFGNAVVEPDGSWWLADQPCGEDASIGYTTLLAVEGRAVVYEPGRSWDQDSAFYDRDALTEITMRP